MGCWRCIAVCAIVLFAYVSAQEKLRLCVQEDVSESSCNALERQNSPLKCQRVIDSANCAINLAEGKADFGVFTADELLLTHHFYPTGVQVVAELRNRDKTYEPFEYQSVVVVPKSYTPSEGGFGALVGSGFCHPGFSKSQMWTDHVLKYFEQKVMNKACQDKVTVAENELINLKDFFKKSCRPGEWVSDEVIDKELKNNYPELCELCDDKQNCKYSRLDSHGHMGALDCLTSGRGQVAYASLYYVKDYFADYRCVENNTEISVLYRNSEPNRSSKKMSDYQFLCDNGTVMPLDKTNPCTWFKQPWKVVLAREEKAEEVTSRLEETSKLADAAQNWEQSLNSILFKDVTPIIYSNNYTSPAHYLSRARDLELPKSECGKDIRWCTVNELERSKCNWTSAAALNLGIKPAISCIPAESPFECFNRISKDEADIITIDSNYGYLARKVYSLSPILYSETTDERNSVVVAVIRDSAQIKRISSWAEVKDSNACFPEYGGIAWLSFVNVARDHGVLPDSCKYPHIVAKMLQGACTPGFVEANHSLGKQKPKLDTDNLSKLCSLCPTQSNGERCEASPINSYFGDRGALECLKEGAGDIAFLEARNIKAFITNGSINASDYRVLCKNGSLAEYKGFDVDATCALSVTIDSEVVSRRDRSKPQLQDTTLALLKIEDWLGYRGDSERRAVHVYDRFNGTENLLFKDSTIGLVSVDSDVKSVLAYKELFSHVDHCSGAMTAVALFSLIFINFIIARFL